MNMPFYVSPEQVMKDRADYARKGIARGRSLVALECAPGVLIVVPNDTGSSPSAGWCSMYSSGASTATRSSLSTRESRPARTMLTFIVPPATGSSWSGAMNSALLTACIIPLFPSVRGFP